MSDLEFMQLKEKFQNMVQHFKNKYKNMLETEIIEQLSLIALYQSYMNFDENKNMKFSSYVYSNMKYAILQEIRNNSIDYNIVSLYEPVNSSDDDNITLLDTIQDNFILDDLIMKNVYKKEAEKNLNAESYEIFLLKYFNYYTNKELQELFNINIYKTLKDIKNTLIKKSTLYKEEYFKIHNLDQYTNPLKQI